MKKLLLLIIGIVGLSVSTSAQNVAVKTNALYWLTTTPNLGVEVALGNKVTLDVSGAYNPWTFKDDKKMRFWLVQPEVRYWFCEKFEGHYIGVHAHGRSISADSIRNAMTVIWRAAVSPTATTGFYPRTGTSKRLWELVMPACGTSKARVFPVPSAARIKPRTISAPRKPPFHSSIYSNARGL